LRRPGAEKKKGKLGAKSLLYEKGKIGRGKRKRLSCKIRRKIVERKHATMSHQEKSNESRRKVLNDLRAPESASSHDLQEEKKGKIKGSCVKSYKRTSARSRSASQLKKRRK